MKEVFLVDNLHMKKILYQIAENKYGKIQPFVLEICAEERKTYHGTYYPLKKEIRIYNMSRPIDFIISTTIHELAHHVDYTKNGSTGHNKRFYGVLKELLTSAVELGYINYEIARKKCDSDDIMKMEKYYGPVVAKEIKEKAEDKYIIKVKKAFEIKDRLKELGFHFNGLERTWEKEDNLEACEELKKKFDSQAEVVIKRFDDISSEICYYIIVSKNTYSCKSELSASGYKWKGYFISENAWVKKIPASELNNEKRFLASLGLNDYKVKNKL